MGNSSAADGRMRPDATGRRSTFERAEFRPAKDDIRGVEALYSVEITATRSLDVTPRKLNKVWGRGLVRHRSLETHAAGGLSAGLWEAPAEQGGNRVSLDRAPLCGGERRHLPDQVLF